MKSPKNIRILVPANTVESHGRTAINNVLGRQRGESPLAHLTPEVNCVCGDLPTILTVMQTQKRAVTPLQEGRIRTLYGYTSNTIPVHELEDAIALLRSAFDVSPYADLQDNRVVVTRFLTAARMAICELKPLSVNG